MPRVVKASGTLEKFDEEKLRRSLTGAGASAELAEKIVEHVSSRVYDGISTDELHGITLEALWRLRPRVAASYNLRRALMMLGPSGYPFEKYYASLLRAYGYRVETDVLLDGRCARHEVDVVAEKGERRLMVECKYHSRPGTKVDLQVALYVYARFLDLREYFTEAWLVTNTKFSEEAIRYARCVGLSLRGWKYPEKEGLERMIESKRLYPVTVIPSLDGEARVRLLKANIVLLRELIALKPEDVSAITGLPIERAARILDEARRIA